MFKYRTSEIPGNHSELLYVWLYNICKYRNLSKILKSKMMLEMPSGRSLLVFKSSHLESFNTKIFLFLFLGKIRNLRHQKGTL